MKRFRLLVLAPDADPTSISTSLVGYAHAAALARFHSVTLVVREGNEERVRQAGGAFEHVEGVRVPALDEVYAWCLRHVFRHDYGSHALTAFNYPFTLAFEWRAWRQMQNRITVGAFDAAIRLLPVTAVLPGAFPYYARATPMPVVLGPINGGLPWPEGFVQAENQREWITGLRNVYRVLPFSRASFRHAAAILAGSSHTFREFTLYRDKLFFVPENGIDCSDSVERGHPVDGGALRLIYVGRLVPYKACDLALRAAAPLLRTRRAQLTIVGDGPERTSLEQLARSLSIQDGTEFCGWLSHGDTLKRLRGADVLVFPSIREFGGGVVFEALAAGVVPVVAAFGGPGDIVTPGTGYAVPLSNPDELTAGMQKALDDLAADPVLLRRLSENGARYAREHLTWDRKAEVVTQVLEWVAGGGARPRLQPPGFQDAGTPTQLY